MTRRKPLPPWRLRRLPTRKLNLITDPLVANVVRRLQDAGLNIYTPVEDVAPDGSALGRNHKK